MDASVRESEEEESELQGWSAEDEEDWKIGQQDTKTASNLKASGTSFEGLEDAR